MELNNDLITQFAKITKINTGKSATTVRAKVVKVADETDSRTYIELDGANEGSRTPAETVVEVAEGDRVLATVKDHSVVITGNKTHPAIGTMENGALRSAITQEVGSIKMEVEQYGKAVSSYEQTVKGFTTKVEEYGNAVSTYNQTVEGFSSTVEKYGESVTTYQQTINEFKQTVQNYEGEYSEFNQTASGFKFITEDGVTYIDGGCIYAENLNLTGAIAWSDLSETAKDNIDGAASDAADAAVSYLEDDVAEAKDTANAAKRAANEALSAAEAVQLPDYIEETYIDKTEIQSPTIIGGTFYAVGSDPDQDATFTVMDENGFYMYYDTDKLDDDGRFYPKISLSCPSNNEVDLILGSGVDDDSEFYNRLYITKGSTYASIAYCNTYDRDNFTGFDFFLDGIMYINATEIRGTNGVFPIGYIYISTDTTSPASLFGGEWERLSGYFLYATGTNSKVGTTVSGGVVTAGGTNSAAYINITAWERVG